MKIFTQIESGPGSDGKEETRESIDRTIPFREKEV